jgi:hypothetical protein
VTTHRAVAFVVNEEHVKDGVSSRRDDSAIHVRVPTRLPHQTGAQMIVVLAKVASLFEHVATFDRR